MQTKLKSEKIIRTIRQYSEQLPEETIEFLQGIAEDYAKVKSYVYRRYSGIGSMGKIYPGFTVQKEIRMSGLRKELNLPDDYMAVAVMDALGGIKSAWSNLKNKIAALIKENKNLTDDERHYVFTILKRDAMYAAVLARRDFERPKAHVGKDLDYRRLDNLICRLTRKYKISPGMQVNTNYFGVSSRGYAYKGGGIRLASRIPQKRVFIPLKDKAAYTKQIRVRLHENYVELIIPVESKIKRHGDYLNTIALSLGYVVMLTASTGNEYGERLGVLLSERTERVYTKMKMRGTYNSAVKKSVEAGDRCFAEKIKRNNLGKKKFISQNNQEMDGIKNYINAEINRMFEMEKPGEIIIPARSKQFAQYMGKATKRKLSRWTVGYIRKRLSDKCAVNGIKLTEINAAYTGLTCSECGTIGRRMNQNLLCGTCGTNARYPLNAARNLYKKAKGTFRIPSTVD